MPYRPKTIDRPWIRKVDYNSMQGQGRKNINPFYKSIAWKLMRERFIKGQSTHLIKDKIHSNAICIECIKQGIITKTHTIDHIKPINQVNAYDTMNGKYGEPLYWNNLQPLCKHHTAIKNGKERSNTSI